MASRRRLRFLVDYCVLGEVFTYLSGRKKISVVSFKDAGLTQRASDEHVLDRAMAERAIVLTGDKRFTEEHKIVCTHEGIVKFEVRNPNAKLRLLKAFMRTRERHSAWKSIVRLRESQMQIYGHGGCTTVSYKT